MRTIEEILAEMSALIDGTEGRSMTEEEVTNYEALEVELKAVQKSDAVRARNAAYRTTVVPAGTPAPAAGRPEDTYEAAFNAFIRTGQPNADLVQLPSNAQSSGVGSEGGYLIPSGFRQKLTDVMKAFGGIANVAEQLTTDTGNTLEWPTIDDTANSAEVVQESNAPANQNGLVFGSKKLQAYTYQTGGPGSVPIRLPRELLQDQQYDLEGKLASLLGRRLARAQATDLATGNGVGKPLGLIFGLTGIKPADDTAGITYNDLLTFIHSVDPAYRQNARWVFNDTSLKRIQQIKDSNGDPLWRSMATSTLADAPGDTMLLGYPITIDQAMPDVVIADKTVNWGAFGDIAEGYVVRNVRSVELVVNPWSRANQREIEYTAWMRSDATQQNTSAYVALTGEAP